MMQEAITRQRERLPKFKDRVYISRVNAQRRKIINESDVVGMLEEQGFTRFYSEKLSFSEIVSSFMFADIFVSSYSSRLEI